MATGVGIDGSDPKPDSDIFSTMSEDDLIVMGKRLFSFYLHDEYESRIRRMLSIGRFTDPEFDSIFVRQYYELPLTYQTVVMEKICKEKGYDGDPQILAFQFYTPLFTLLQYCDSDPGKMVYAERMIEYHVREFGRRFTGGYR